MSVIKFKRLTLSLSLLTTSTFAGPNLPTPPSTFSSQAACIQYIHDNYFMPLSRLDLANPYNYFFLEFSRPISWQHSVSCSSTNPNQINCIEYQGGNADTGDIVGTGCMLAESEYSKYWPTALEALKEEVQRANNNEPTLPARRYAVKCTFKYGDKANKTCELISKNSPIFIP